MIFFYFSTSCWKVKLIDLTGYIGFFRPLHLLLGGQNDWLYWIYCIFSTFWLFDLFMGGQIDWFYWIYIGIFWLYDFLTCCWKVNLIDFTEILNFFDFWPVGGRSKWFLLNILIFLTFRLLDLLLGGQNDQFYGIYLIFSTWEVKMIKFTEYIALFSTFRFFALLGRSKWLITE